MADDKKVNYVPGQQIGQTNAIFKADGTEQLQHVSARLRSTIADVSTI